MDLDQRLSRETQRRGHSVRDRWRACQAAQRAFSVARVEKRAAECRSASQCFGFDQSQLQYMFAGFKDVWNSFRMADLSPQFAQGSSGQGRSWPCARLALSVDLEWVHALDS
jgi:hypothetical protein